MPSVLLTYYCVAILFASVLGGMLPRWLRLTHRWMECAVSLVAGVMLGVAVLHLLPHALAAVDAEAGPDRFVPVGLWVLAGFLAMFFVERFFCFHHHDVPGESAAAGGGIRADAAAEAGADNGFGCCEHDHAHSDHTHDITWSGAAFGLTLHSLMAGVALAASVQHGVDGASVAGLGTFLAVVLHKPFDSMTIAMLMARGGWSPSAQAVVNALFSLAIPAGVGLAYVGGVAGHGDPGAAAVGPALAFSAGVFLCISMSDLLPELQFHHHDRMKLSAALLIGLALAYAACRLETHSHGPAPPANSGGGAAAGGGPPARDTVDAGTQDHGARERGKPSRRSVARPPQKRGKPGAAPEGARLAKGVVLTEPQRVSD